MPALPFQFVPECPRQCPLLAYNAPKVCELIHFLNLPPYDLHTIVTFGTKTHQLCLGGIDLQAYLRT